MKGIKKALLKLERNNDPLCASKHISDEEKAELVSMLDEEIARPINIPTRHLLQCKLNQAKGQDPAYYTVKGEPVPIAHFLSCMTEEEKKEPRELIAHKEKAEMILHRVRDNHVEYPSIDTKGNKTEVKTSVSIITARNVYDMCKLMMEENACWNLEDKAKEIPPFEVEGFLCYEANAILEGRFEEEQKDRIEAHRLTQSGQRIHCLQQEADTACQHMLDMVAERNGWAKTCPSVLQKEVNFEIVKDIWNLNGLRGRRFITYEDASAGRTKLKNHLREEALKATGKYPDEDALEAKTALYWNSGLSV
jgi:hypothetical protein